ncbi:MAG: ATP-grasp domain-containing protein [Defluviicoccus sp.]|nr:ATP-grasp domain-containing protein [Defluviicoccus sp.]
MKIAVVYNRDSRNVINLFGMPNRERIGLRTIRRLTDALKQGGHQVVSMEADKDLVDRLEDFMPQVIKGERPGMVFNVSYGLQGQARYTHVPSILEMVGIPYVGSGPLGHSLALDKVVTKMLLRQRNVPTPDFAVLDTPEAELPPDLAYPMIVKPKNEAVSFGLKVVDDEDSLREAASVIFNEFHQPVLAEQYITGREINVGVLGNDPVEAFEPVMLHFGEGAQIYTYEDKTGRSGREIRPICPAPIGAELTERAKEIAIQTFNVLGLSDCARIDMRLDDAGRLFVLEANSLPSLGEHGSYLVGAAYAGLDFTQFVNRLVDVATARYFGVPNVSPLEAGPKDVGGRILQYVTQNRERIERQLRDWVQLSSSTNDPVGIEQAVGKAAQMLEGLGLQPVDELTDGPEVWTWSTPAWSDGGTLLIANLDTPVDTAVAAQPYRRDPEWVYGEGIGTSRGSLTILEFALRALRRVRRLRRTPLAVLLYTDEGRSALHSAQLIREAASRARRVIVLSPVQDAGDLVTNRRGSRRYRLDVEGEPIRPGQRGRRVPVLRWTWKKLDEMTEMTSSKTRLAVEVLDIAPEKHPMMAPHRVSATVMVTYFNAEDAERVERRMREILGKRGRTWKLTMLSDRPPMKERAAGMRLARALEAVCRDLELPVGHHSSAWPSVAGLVPARVGCVCGLGPVCRDRGTAAEAVQRVSLVQRALLLAAFLSESGRERKK